MNIAYTTSNITAVPRLICNTALSEVVVVPSAAWNAAGTNREEIAKASNDDAVCAVSLSVPEKITEIQSG